MPATETKKQCLDCSIDISFMAYNVKRCSSCKAKREKERSQAYFNKSSDRPKKERTLNPAQNMSGEDRAQRIGAYPLAAGMNKVYLGDDTAILAAARAGEGGVSAERGE